jgi:hypothetical protein
VRNPSARAGNGARTRNPQLGRLMLFQLSYSRPNQGTVYDSSKSLSIQADTLDDGEGRIRTSEGIANRFTVCPLWPLGNLSSVNL